MTMLRQQSIAGPDAAVSVGAGVPDPAVPVRDDRRNFLLVHGAWHAAAHWNRVAERLAAMGHTVSAIDLPGSGLNAAYPDSYLRGDADALVTEPSPVAGIRLADYTNAVVDQLTKMARHGKVTLVGHSFGGLTVTRAAEAVPDLVRRVVYISAYVPVKFPNGAAYGELPEGASSISGAILIGDPTKTGALRVDPRNVDPDYVEAGRMAFYNDMSTAEYFKLAGCLNPDLPLGVAFDDARGTPERWGAVPRTFIRLSDDRTVPPALQDRMIAEADEATPGNPFDVHTLPSSHSPFASMPGRLAAVLDGLD
jgi:pimeloyl-ACP methyl ester carboxylesterase